MCLIWDRENNLVLKVSNFYIKFVNNKNFQRIENVKQVNKERKFYQKH